MHNEMMQQVWMLNSVGVSAAELQNLIDSFLAGQEKLDELKFFVAADAQRLEFWLTETRLSVQRLEQLQVALSDAISLLTSLDEDGRER